mmetsp:Transcript_49887/g.79514  ORF Transcript_49887/g.79514 Transcript_49887/m.79514 type:complete len:221 (-) Transcript_49887:988-1650(-)
MLGRIVVFHSDNTWLVLVNLVQSELIDQRLNLVDFLWIILMIIRSMVVILIIHIIAVDITIHLVLFRNFHRLVLDQIDPHFAFLPIRASTHYIRYQQNESSIIGNPPNIDDILKATLQIPVDFTVFFQVTQTMAYHHTVPIQQTVTQYLDILAAVYVFVAYYFVLLLLPFMLVFFVTVAVFAVRLFVLCLLHLLVIARGKIEHIIQTQTVQNQGIWTQRT